MFKGSMVAIATPMQDDGSVDFESLDKLVDFHLDNQTDVIIPAGTTGESATLDHQEHCEVIKRVVDRVKGRVPVIGGTGANSTWEAISLTRCAAEAGVDACLLVTPYYNKPTQEGLFQHYKKVAEEVDIPQILYNVPGRTACDMLPETVARLSKIKNIVGVKEASGELARGIKIRELCGPDFMIVSGEDFQAMESILAGGQGVISVTANVAPKLMHEMCQAALAGNREKAQEINAKIEDLHRDLFIESNPIPTKWSLHEMGLIPPGLRLPLTPLDKQYHDVMRSALKKAGCI
ncbi:MAG: 4-hydroxy-tetrahydrodipicolinate synthase [Gammaproteobacteria bacterium]|nr:4-hydroxy-tetrahydrodipicolinate synthase [Gammaproteobacteria bacterium]